MRRLLTLLRRFRSDRRGNIAILFGLAVVPIFGIMGAALDYSVANSQRTAIQAALDNTALTLSKMMPLSDADLQSYGWKVFNANLGSSPLQYTQPNLTITQGANGKLMLQINTSYPMKMASVMTKFFGMSPNMAVDAHSEVQWGNGRLRVALVLDNSGSMASANKMTALKTAAKNLITTLSAVAKNPEDVYISIIPFSKDVNLGTATPNPDYIDWTEWDSDNGYCSTDSGTRQSRCGTCSISSENKKSDCTSAGVCSLSQYSGKNSCTNNGGTWNAGVWTSNWTADHSKWNGCVKDRGKSAGPGTNADYDQKIDPVDQAKVETKFPADQYSLCTQAVQGLTNTWATLNTIVDNMQPNGSTNQPIGLVWGWQSLGGGGPFEAKSMDTANYAYSQIIILLSDGLNTEDRWYGNGHDTSTDVNNRMYYKSGSTITGTCQNIKDVTINPITIYSVQVNTGGDAQSDVLKACASDASKFFELKTSDAIVTTFDQIGSALANIHLSK